MKKTKVGFLCEFFYPDNLGSTGTIISHLARFLHDSFNDVRLSAVTSTHLYRGVHRPLKRRENWKGIFIRRVHTPHTKQPSTIKRLLAGIQFSLAVFVKLVLGPRLDVVIALTNPPVLPLVALWLQQLRGTKVIYLIHDLYADMSVAMGQASPDSRAIRLSQKLQGYFLRQSDAVVVLGRCMKEHLDTNFTLPSDKVRVIPNWGSIQHPVGREESRFRLQHGWTNKFVVLYAGNFGQFHNFDSILDAAQILSAKRDDIVFALVGGGAKRDEVEETARRKNLNNVQFFPFVPASELPDLMGSCDVALVTLEPGTEGLAVPCKFYNILAAGRATIALMGEKAETARVIAEEKCGARVDGDDAEGLAQTLESLANNLDSTHAMGRRARNAFERSYTLDFIGNKFHDLIGEVVGGHSLPVPLPVSSSSPPAHP
ncbi:hypothetical protein IAD21_01516 [Abditibacteriota bacterium]|nr:hypothetical protein IAD21_01516 [Abditibacteriota bacterium]